MPRSFTSWSCICKEIELGESIHAGGVQAQSEEDVRKNTKPFKESIDWFLLRFYRKLSEHHTDLLRVLNNLVLLIALYAGFVYMVILRLMMLKPLAYRNNYFNI